MKIGIYANMFLRDHKAGIPTAVENVLRSWSENHPENEYYLFCRTEKIKDNLAINWNEHWHLVCGSSFLGTSDFSKVIGNSIFFKLVYRFLILPCHIRKQNLNLFWGPCYLLPFGVKSEKKVVSVYDMAMYRFKHISERKNEIIQKIGLPWSVRKADKIIAISRATAKDIHRILKVKKNKVFISYLGGLNHKNEQNIQETNNDIRDELKIKGKFILFISTIEPRKNIITLVKAFEKYLDSYREDDLHLVIAGGKGWNCDSIYDAMLNSRYNSKIIVPGYISNDEKSYLLDHASVFAYPSLYEGFGIPILEAFDRGLAVITTNVSSMPEVGGNAAFYINDPFDIDELVCQLRKILTLSEDETILVKGKMRHQISKFSWDKNAEEIMRMFKKLCFGKMRNN